MERDYPFENYRSGREARERNTDFYRRNRSGDYHDDFEDRYRERGHNRYPDEENRYYRQQDYDMERNYYSNVGNSDHSLDNIRQGYGMPSFGDTSDRHRELENMKRERESQRRQGYGTGRAGGYSGSAFGGANYSSHGDFGGSSRYGAMSGFGGNADDDVSSSGYGGGYGNRNDYSGRGSSEHEQRGRYGFSQGGSGRGQGRRNGGGYYDDDDRMYRRY